MHMQTLLHNVYTYLALALLLKDTTSLNQTLAYKTGPELLNQHLHLHKHNTFLDLFLAFLCSSPPTWYSSTVESAHCQGDTLLQQLIQ